MGKQKTLQDIINKYAKVQQQPLTATDYAAAFVKLTGCSEARATYFATHGPLKERKRETKR